MTFDIPADVSTSDWEVVCDTFDPAHTGGATKSLDVGPRSVAVLCAPAGEQFGNRKGGRGATGAENGDREATVHTVAGVVS